MNIQLNSRDKLDKSGLYKITNDVNGNWYVGSTSSPFSKRLSTHLKYLRGNKHTNGHLQNSYNKYGDKNFTFSIVSILPHDKALLEEQKILDENVGKDYCYNICKDAVAPMMGRKHTPEALLKMSAFSKSRAKEIGECTRKHRLGSKHPKKTIQKMRLSAKNRDDSKRVAVLKSREFRERVSKTLTGTKWTPERRETSLKIMKSDGYRQKMSEVKKGVLHLDNAKSKMSEARLGRKITLQNRDIKEEVLSLRNFCEKFNLNRKTLSDLINGKRTEYKGWKLK